MSFWSALFGTSGQAISEPINAIGNVIDKLFTSDEEKLDKKIILERLIQVPALAQVELNKIEASHKSVFVSGWRPYIGWVCGAGLTFHFIINPIIQWITGHAGIPMQASELIELVIAMLGLSAMRTYEKLKNIKELNIKADKEDLAAIKSYITDLFKHEINNLKEHTAISIDSLVDKIKDMQLMLSRLKI